MSTRALRAQVESQSATGRRLWHRMVTSAANTDLRPGTPILKFTVGGLSCALPLEDVEEVTAMVGLTPLPGAMSNLLGVIDYHGTPCPVLDLRHLLNLPAVELQPEQHLLVLRLNERPFAIPCDRADAVLWGSVRPVVADGTSGPFIQGLMHDEKGAILVLDSVRLMGGTPEAEGELLRIIPGQQNHEAAPETP